MENRETRFVGWGRLVLRGVEPLRPLKGPTSNETVQKKQNQEQKCKKQKAQLVYKDSKHVNKPNKNWWIQNTKWVIRTRHDSVLNAHLWSRGKSCTTLNLVFGGMLRNTANECQNSVHFWHLPTHTDILLPGSSVGSEAGKHSVLWHCFSGHLWGPASLRKKKVPAFAEESGRKQFCNSMANIFHS